MFFTVKLRKKFKIKYLSNFDDEQDFFFLTLN